MVSFAIYCDPIGGYTLIFPFPTEFYNQKDEEMLSKLNKNKNKLNCIFRRPLDDRDYRFEGSGPDRWDHPPYSGDPQTRLPVPPGGDRLNTAGYPDGGGGPPFSGGYPGGDRYDRYGPGAENERYAGENVAPYEAAAAAAGRDYYDERLGSRKYPPEDDFQTLRQRYDEDY
jgi:hypothetical protein